jgi:hypothetical protein
LEEKEREENKDDKRIIFRERERERERVEEEIKKKSINV